MDRLFALQKEWDRERTHGDPAIMEAVLARWCPYSLDRWKVLPEDWEPVAEEDGLRVVPYGDIGFMRRWLNAVGADDPDMTPIEVPEALMPFLRREYHRFPYADIPGEMLDMSRWFLKDASSLKSWNSSLLFDDSDPLAYMEPGHDYIVSEKVGFSSEYRVFVHRDEAIGVRQYAGDPLVFPDGEAIRDMICAYSETAHPDAYTLDVGVRDATEPIEVHPFVSCGLYGFEDRELPDMIDDGLAWYLGKAAANSGHAFRAVL